jgi:iron complex outermembrane receptor protein
VVQRYQRDPYPVWDVSVARERGWIHPYIQATNLSNTGYEEIEGVRMQGRSFVGGLEFTFPRH